MDHRHLSRRSRGRVIALTSSAVLLAFGGDVPAVAAPAGTPGERPSRAVTRKVGRPASGSHTAPSGEPGAAIDWDEVGRRAVRLLRELLAIDTTNPPGNEIEAARFFARHLDRAGIPHEVFESEPGRGNVVARLQGDGSGGGGILLLNHLDVVPADPTHWSVDPFGGELGGGMVYGRGAVDMKAYGVAQLLAFIALHEADLPLSRDVVFMGTAGEETGGFVGAGYVASERPDLLEGLAFVLTEGGGGTVIDGRIVHRIETTQKTPLWLRLQARGDGGHGSMPVEDSAVNRLIRALERIRTYRGELKIVEPVRAALEAEAELFPESELARILGGSKDDGTAAGILELVPPEFAPLLRNTISITVLQGSDKTNVIPPSAVAELDCRLLPGQDPELFVATLRDVVDDPGIVIEELLSFPPAASPRDTRLWEAIAAAVREDEPGAAFVPTVLPGFTDSHFFRQRGMVAYGWAPFVYDGDVGVPHGVDERISVAGVMRAPRLLFDVVVNLAASGDRRP